jgi:iron complex transport system ATP-binding protein
MNLLRKLSRETGKGILVATHELDLALQMADLIWLAENSQTIVTGIPEDLVLDGSFDRVFQFKGFDLRSGKVQHDVTKKKSIHLIGEGSNFLWTKNALERNGYEVSDLGTTEVIVEPDQKWKLNNESFGSIGELLKRL